MRTLAFALLFTVSLVWQSPADAQIFGKKTKTPPAQRIGELIVQAQSDPSESKRVAAAEELRQFDAKTHPEVVPVLIDIVRSDKSAGVRNEAIDSLSRIRPVSQSAGQTIEWAAAHDNSWKVRWHAKSALTRYQFAGYRAAKNDGKTTTMPATQEPPLIDAARPQVKPGLVNRTPSTKTHQPPANVVSQPPSLPKIVNQPPSLPVIVTQPQPQVVQQPAANSPPIPTPPPIIVDAPGTAVAPPLKAPVPALPVLDSGPRLGAPHNVPALGPPTAPVEPNFRPAGQSPPRVPSAPKGDDRGPALTPPI